MSGRPADSEPQEPSTADLDRSALFELALESADAITWVWDLRTDRLTWTGRGVDFMFGVPTDITSVSGVQFLDLVHPDDRRMVLKKVGHIASHGGSVVIDYRARRANGEQCWHLYRGSAVVDEEGTVIRILGVTQDITERRMMEEALRESEEQFRRSEERFKTVLDSSPLAIVAFDLGGRVTLAQGSALESLVEAEQLLGSAVREVLADHPEALTAVDRVLGGDTVDARLEVSGMTFDTSYRPLRDTDSAVTGAVIVATDVSEKVRAERQLARLTLHDPLTDLANRVLFNDRLELHLARSARRRGHTAVLFLDLDRFKEINDTHGHHIGDDLLRGVADRLRSSVRPEDTIARFGGDEFLILGEVSNATEAEAMARRILRTVAEPMQIGSLTVEVGVSIGAAVTGPTPERDVPETAASLIRHADGAMYRAKQAGKGRFVVVEATSHAQPTSN